MTEPGATSTTWEHLSTDTTYERKAGIVNGYQISDNFVKPFTQDTGRSVSLLLNPETPIEPEVMVIVSHTWEEDILEIVEALVDRAKDDVQQEQINCVEALTIWFCILAQQVFDCLF